MDEQQVQPYPRRSAIALHEGMGNVHFNVLVDDLFDGLVGHSADVTQHLGKEVPVSENEAAFGNGFRPDLPREWI